LSFGIILSAALLHELGHFILIKLCGAKIKRVDIEVLGAVIAYSEVDTSLNSDISIALGGIVFNLVAAVVGIAFFTCYYDLYLLIFIAANLSLAFVNMLPAAGLDGGRALNALLLKRFDIIKAERVSRVVSLVAKIFLIALSAMLMVLSCFNTAMIILFLLKIQRKKSIQKVL